MLGTSEHARRVRSHTSPGEGLTGDVTILPRTERRRGREARPDLPPPSPQRMFRSANVQWIGHSQVEWLSSDAAQLPRPRRPKCLPSRADNPRSSRLRPGGSHEPSSELTSASRSLATACMRPSCHTKMRRASGVESARARAAWSDVASSPAIARGDYRSSRIVTNMRHASMWRVVPFSARRSREKNGLPCRSPGAYGVSTLVLREGSRWVVEADRCERARGTSGTRPTPRWSCSPTGRSSRRPTATGPRASRRTRSACGRRWRSWMRGWRGQEYPPEPPDASAEQPPTVP